MLNSVKYYMGSEGQTWTVERLKLRGKGWTTLYSGSREGCLRAVKNDSQKITETTGLTTVSRLYEYE